MSYYKITNLKIGNPWVKKPVKLLQIADLHLHPKTNPKTLNQITSTINNLEKDYICMVGDMIDHPDFLKQPSFQKMCLDFFYALDGKILFVLGSHDYMKHQNQIVENALDFFMNLEKTLPNFYLLNNSSYEDKNIYAFGYTIVKEGYQKDEILSNNAIKKDILKRKQQPSQKKKPQLFLLHSPTIFTDENLLSCFTNDDLILAGHMHNGLVPPLLDELWASNTGLITPTKKFPAKFARGFRSYSNDQTIVNVTSAMTKLAKSNLILNHLNPFYPIGIDTITLVKAPKSKIYTYQQNYKIIPNRIVKK